MTPPPPTRRPAHLSSANAATWLHPDAVAAYEHRAPYPAALIARLAEAAGNGNVLDLGCGTGAIARPLAPHVRAIDAVLTLDVGATAVSGTPLLGPAGS